MTFPLANPNDVAYGTHHIQNGLSVQNTIVGSRGDRTIQGGLSTFRWFLNGWFQAVHVVASVTVVTEEELIVILRGATEVAGLAFNTLPAVCPHNC